LIRHANQAGRPAFAVLALPIAMIQPAFEAALMPPVRCTVLMDPCLTTAGRAAVTLATITVGADEEQGRTSMAQTKPRAENRFAMNRHACRRRSLTTANRSWEVKS